MTRDDIFLRLRDRMAVLFEVEPEAIALDSLLTDDLDADSIDVLELVLTLKDEFGVTISDGEVKALLVELARFLPDSGTSDAPSDDELARIANQLRVETIVDFVVERTSAAA